MTAKDMYMKATPSNITEVKENLERHIMMTSRTKPKRFKGMKPPMGNDRLPDDMYRTMMKVFERKLDQIGLKGNHDENKTNNSRGKGRAKKCRQA